MALRYPNIIHKYHVFESLGDGSFGKVFRGEHIKTKEAVAIKLESVSHPFPLIKHETFILHYLHSKKCLNIPLIIWYGKVEEWNVVVMPCYDYTLDVYIREYIGPTTPLSSVIKVFQMMIHVVQQIHKHGIVHRDLKPQNFILKGSELVLLDFGFSQFYWENMNGKHKSEQDSKKNHLIGTLPYISYFVHCGLDVSRRDDVLSILYIFVYLLYGELYWEHLSLSSLDSHVSGCHDKTDIEYPRNVSVREMKQCDVLLLYLSNHDPLYPQWTPVLSVLREIVKYLYQLSFLEMPEYDYLFHKWDEL
jgi:serine/threonine protein kinase